MVWPCCLLALLFLACMTIPLYPTSPIHRLSISISIQLTEHGLALLLAGPAVPGLRDDVPGEGLAHADDAGHLVDGEHLLVVASDDLVANLGVLRARSVAVDCLKWNVIVFDLNCESCYKQLNS